MTEGTVLNLILTYKYPLLLPISFFEGHGISLLVGFLARLGHINPILAGVIIAAGNLLGDIALYWLGYHKGRSFIDGWGHHIGITNERFIRASEIFHVHKEWILFVSKVTNGMGLAMGLLFTAGAVRIPFRTYLLWNTLGEIVWTSVLVGIGYFFGELYRTIDALIVRVGALSLGILILVLLFFQVRKYIESKLPA